MHTIASRDLFDCHRVQQITDLLYLLVCKLGFMVCFTLSSASTTFLFPVTAIVSISPKKQVIRTYTRRIITCMTDQQTIRDWTICQFPCYTMRQCRSFCVVCECAISPYITVSYPEPASFRFSYFFPKPMGNRTYRTCRFIHPGTRNLLLKCFSGWMCLPIRRSRSGHFCALFRRFRFTTKMSTAITGLDSVFVDIPLYSCAANTKRISDFLHATRSILLSQPVRIMQLIHTFIISPSIEEV